MGFTLFLFIRNQNENIKPGRIAHISCIRQNKQMDKQIIPKPPQKMIQFIYFDNQLNKVYG